MSTPNGYNNPAFCHQYDSSLYEYQYVPEIDPDSPNLSEESNRRKIQTKLVHPSFGNFRKNCSESDEFEGSDESNGSIIIEECNNRRVTLICEKRNKTDANSDEFYEDGSFTGAYYQDISLESENGYDTRNIKKQSDYEGRHEEKSLRHQGPLEPPTVHNNSVRCYSGTDTERRTSSNSHFKQSTTSINSYYRPPQRYHRYEEIPSGEDFHSLPPATVHRYAEISSDENGYPTLTREIKIKGSSQQIYGGERETGVQKIKKPRAISPVNYSDNFTPPSTPSRSYQRNLHAKSFELSLPQLSPNSSPFIYSSSPVKTNSFEMSELSPPRLSHNSKYSGNGQTFFIHSPKRQPPIGASAANESQESYSLNGRCIIPKNLQQFSSRSVPNTPRRQKDVTQFSSPPVKINSAKKVSQIFHIKPVKSKSTPRETAERENYPVRRNISNSFTDPSTELVLSTKSPYKPTTVEIVPPKTAIITPISQRRNHQSPERSDLSFSPKRNFEKMSHAFQSTGNIFKSSRDPNGVDFPTNLPKDKLTSPVRMKRNQSVPNFSQTLAAESRNLRKTQDTVHESQKYSKNLDFQYSPKKPLEHVISFDKSRISLIDQTKSSWTNSELDFYPKCSICFIFAAVVHLVTATATCAICFYLLSKVGRKYYLDFGLLAGFVNFILGLLGFRSYCWRWLPNRNYVSGFIGLAAFSALTCAGLTYLITAKPMAGDPILDITGGAICAVSVLTIVLALTGLTMSGCCKAPPPDNRVTDI